VTVSAEDRHGYDDADTAKEYAAKMALKIFGLQPRRSIFRELANVGHDKQRSVISKEDADGEPYS
jgi:hypothetical protein